MIIERLTITDFRVFKDRHTFDLSPRTKYGKKRPIILYGGLNGAGKTTTLTAVRLVLYGKQSLGIGTSQKTYDDFLIKSIHKSKNTLVQANSSCIELTFSYANMGVYKHYTIKRSWFMKGKKVAEKLAIYEDSNELKELNAEQCQGFLNELIPIGLSDLFFFDSEKIAELAEDTGGHALGDAVKKLLGLDLIDTLNSDLTIFLRNASKRSATLDIQTKLSKLEKELGFYEKKGEAELVSYETALAYLSEINIRLVQLENDLSSRGGAWAASREKEMQNKESLCIKKERVQKEIREVIDGSYPISLGKKFVNKTVEQLINESVQKKNNNTSEIVSKRISSLRNNIKKSVSEKEFEKINKYIDKEFISIIKPKKKVEIIHDISDKQLISIEVITDDAIRKQTVTLKELSIELNSINRKIDMAGKNIERAPDELVIKPVISEIYKMQSKRAEYLASKNIHGENRKRYLREAIDVVNKLDKLYSQLSEEGEMVRIIQYATNSKVVLNGFAKEMARRKIKDLENEFINSFQRLARKEDVNLRAEINPIDFSVKLIDANNLVVDKDELSAGEKQIFAIAILEALARTSGRKLPIIIDTPLARLDSVHRTNLIKNYFPFASHQVIILSTDTEVDEEFYDELSNKISHAYKLDFDDEQKCAITKEGYFWKSKQTETV